MNSFEYDISQMDEYTEHIIKNINDVPKNIFEIMDNFNDAYEIRLVALKIERLARNGLIKLHHSSGPLFQDRYYVKNIK